MPAENRQSDGIATAVTEVSDRVSLLVREEIELAKAEVTQKVTSIGRGVAAVAAGAVFGVFALTFALLTIAWAINSATGDLWPGFLAVFLILLALTIFVFLFAWRKLRVGAPTPTMAIDEAKRIRETVQARELGAAPAVRTETRPETGARR